MEQHNLIKIYEAGIAAGEITADPAQAAILGRLEDMRCALEATAARPRGGLKRLFARKAGTAPRGLYLWGGVGRGKSMLMDMFFAGTRIRRKRRVHFHAFMQEVHAALHAARQTGTDDAIRPVAKAITDEVRLLCLDEMQITDITDAMLVGRLFEAFLAAGVSIVTTSNRPPADLYKDGLNRALFVPFIALIQERLDVAELSGAADYRQGVLAGGPVWFTPADGAARAALDRIWNELAGGPGAPLHIPLKGRELVLPAFRNGIARAGFAELCERPLGPADFLAIAGAVRVLMIDAIPVMDRSRNNAAKRFVTLIDALYEGRVRLVASAGAAPEALYVQGAGAFEFARTASRLAEMQGADWAGAPA